jgi:pantoate--beta-alanine ligase
MMDVWRRRIDIPPPAGRRAVVMTMGALHEGHARLMRVARERVGPHGEVVATIFVNPLQFGANEDLAAYPRTEDADLLLCEESGVSGVYVPEVVDVYPDGERTTIRPGPRGEVLEGASRPGHFAGMATVVGKLMQIIRPDEALFGEKDYQQLVIVREMVADLNFPVEVIGVPTVRESDGLAMSSRNRYLSNEERAWASSIPRALAAAAQQRSIGSMIASVREQLDPHVIVDYVVVRTAELDEVVTPGIGRLLFAGHVGTTRLLDNWEVEIHEV